MDFGDEGEARSAHAAAVAITAVRDRLKKVGTSDCIECGTVIPSARREVLPSACRCVDCQERYERGI